MCVDQTLVSVTLWSWVCWCVCVCVPDYEWNNNTDATIIQLLFTLTSGGEKTKHETVTLHSLIQDDRFPQSPGILELCKICIEIYVVQNAGATFACQKMGEKKVFHIMRKYYDRRENDWIIM